jgi:hypothetical protein
MEAKAVWAETQPKHGDVILKCRHVGSSGKWHWFHIDPAVVFKRRDRTSGLARWRSWWSP